VCSLVFKHPYQITVVKVHKLYYLVMLYIFISRGECEMVIYVSLFNSTFNHFTAQFTPRLKGKFIHVFTRFFLGILKNST